MTTKRIHFKFPAKAASQPVVTHLVRDYNLDVNIFHARVNQKEEGFMMLDLTGSDQEIANGLEYLKSLRIEIHDADIGLQWDETRCTSCGNCLNHCPTNALYIPDRSTMKVDYRSDKCVECLNCIDNCPFGACSSLI
ncbi:MAG: 4Fe-4S binding protein [Spirochaetales bacterium]|nr:4Fe-4S binding protein [Spirochaetales bacterium]